MFLPVAGNISLDVKQTFSTYTMIDHVYGLYECLCDFFAKYFGILK